MKFLFRPVFLGLFVFWIFFPFLSIIIWSVAAGWRFPDIPKQYSARGYAVSLDPNGDIVQGAITSTVIALIVGLLATAIGSAAGRAIAMYTFKMKKIFQFLVLAPLIVPGLAVTMGIQILFIKYGLSDTMRGVIWLT
jgi:putative spermidine/putrescine transport system permease protein